MSLAHQTPSGIAAGALPTDQPDPEGGASGRHGASRYLSLPLLWLLRGYQLFISPLRPPTCRFYPSCSAYAVTAVTRFGPLTGSWLAVKRVCRCHPWNPGGVDYVPSRADLKARSSRPHTHSEQD